MKTISILAVALVLLWVAPAVSAEGNAVDGVDAATYDVYLPGSFTSSGTLYAAVPQDYDTYNLHVTAATTVVADVSDCCIMGDTIALGTGLSSYVKATSPATIHVSKALPAGNYKVYVGYIASPGGFPAGYSATFTG